MRKLKDLTLEELWQLFPITLCEHNSKYRDYYLEEEKKLQIILGKYNIANINHIGSTAINMIKAKPTVDILMEINDIDELEDIINTLNTSNWGVMNRKYNPLKISLNKGYTINGYGPKVYHLHIKMAGDNDEVYFRDYLNDNYDVAKQYEQLKEKLLIENPVNRDAYTDGKTEFVNNISKLARKRYGKK